MNPPYGIALPGLCIVGAVLWAQPVARSEIDAPIPILSADPVPLPDADERRAEDEHRITLGSPCPLTTCSDASCRLIQSQDTVTDGEDQIACGAGPYTTENAWARCYDLANEGVPGGGPLTIDSVKFGVQQATRDGIRIDVILYLDINGCPPDAPGEDAMELCRESIEVNIADEGSMITVPFPQGPVVPAGADLIVEIASVDDGLQWPFFAFRTMANLNGECAHSYLRSAQCGFPGWIWAGDISWHPHLIQIVNGTVGGLAAECGNNEVEGCEGCDPPDGLHCDESCRWICGDGVVQETEECDPPDDMGCDTDCTLLDCNNNGIPDECIELENDCNSNGIPDECDIADGTSEDCSFITHDCCESDHGPGCNDPNIEACVCAVAPTCCDVDWAQGCVKVVEILDCGSCEPNNGNGIPDECEADCNENGQADSCDIGEGASDDDDGDGVPDECQSPADLNGDGVVNAADLAILLAAWGPCPDCDDCPPDLDGDCAVGPFDLAQLLGSWGEFP